MRKLTLTLVFTVMFSSTSFAEWTEVTKNVHGDTFYVDFERIRKVDGYVYYLILQNHPKPNKYGNFSLKGYRQGDSKLFRIENLSTALHNQPMGEDTGDVFNSENPKWDYAGPESVGELFLKSVCSKWIRRWWTRCPGTIDPLESQWDSKYF